ncbi:MAG: GNAT family N-acetyltransferase, partial [Rhizobiaceae bacterium]
MNVRIRAALVADIDALLAIENAAFATDRISRRSFRLLIERDTASVLVADEGDGLMGYCVVLYRTGSGVARLYSIAVSPGTNGRGVGKALLQAAEDAAFENDRLILRLEVREDNPRAIMLYEKNGYRPIGKEPDYYEDGATALRYEKMLRG